MYLQHTYKCSVLNVLMQMRYAKDFYRRTLRNAPGKTKMKKITIYVYRPKNKKQNPHASCPLGFLLENFDYITSSRRRAVFLARSLDTGLFGSCNISFWAAIERNENLSPQQNGQSFDLSSSEFSSFSVGCSGPDCIQSRLVVLRLGIETKIETFTGQAFYRAAELGRDGVARSYFDAGILTPLSKARFKAFRSSQRSF